MLLIAYYCKEGPAKAVTQGLTKTSRDAGTPSLGPVSHQVDGLGAITMSDVRMP